MIDLRFGRYVLGVCMAIAMLAGCGGAGAGNGVLPANVTPNHLPGQRTFHYTGKGQDFKVPAGVTQITVVARGAAGGGDGNYEGRDIQALGGRVRAIIPVRPGERLAVFVGGQGSRPDGGFNGGGNGAGEPSCCEGYGGGGASDIRQGGDTLANRILVAGGGGGAEAFGWPEYGGLGGKGGGIDAGAGSNGYTAGGSSNGGYGGGGGTQNTGGDGGAPGYGSSGSGGDSGSSGSLGAGGSGGEAGGASSYAGGGGGGGGGGYYGGGGGGGGGGYYGAPGGGGGGGSAYIESSAHGGRSWQGWKNASGDGLVVLSW